MRAVGVCIHDLRDWLERRISSSHPAVYHDWGAAHLPKLWVSREKLALPHFIEWAMLCRNGAELGSGCCLLIPDESLSNPQNSSQAPGGGRADLLPFAAISAAAPKEKWLCRSSLCPERGVSREGWGVRRTQTYMGWVFADNLVIRGLEVHVSFKVPFYSISLLLW